MDKAEKATEIIAEQRKLPKEVKDKLDNYTFINLIMSIALMIYMLVINFLYLNEEEAIVSTCIKIFAMVLISIDIVIFEIGYRKDSLRIWLHAFELLVCSVLILSLEYIYLYASNLLKSLFMLLPVFCSIYYVAKIIIKHIAETKKYQNNLSDVKELIKDEEEGYLDDIKTEDVVNEVNSLAQTIKQEQEVIKRMKKEQKKRGGNND